MDKFISKLNENQKLSKQERLNQIIAKSKMLKEEKQKRKEDNENKIKIID